MLLRFIQPQTLPGKPRKPNPSLRETPLPKLIIQVGWSVPVVHSFEQFRLADTGICLAMRSEAEEAMRELRSGSGLAILTTKQIEAGSEEIEFEVKTSQGQSTMWKRCLVQLGDVPVTYKCSAPRGGAVEADTSLLVVGFPKKYCHSDAWKTAMTRPKSATAYWEPVDFLPPRSPRLGGIDGVEVVGRVQKDNVEKVLCGSGEFGVFSRPFFVKGDARVYKDVPLPVEIDLQAALRKAKAVGPSILGVVWERVSDCVRRSATSRVSLARSSQRRKPRGLS